MKKKDKPWDKRIGPVRHIRQIEDDTRLDLTRSGMVELAGTFKEAIDLLSSADFQKKLSTERGKQIVKFVTDGLRLELLELEEELGT